LFGEKFSANCFVPTLEKEEKDDRSRSRNFISIQDASCAPRCRQDAGRRISFCFDMQMVLKFRAPVEMKLPKSFVFETCLRLHPPSLHFPQQG